MLQVGFAINTELVTFLLAVGPHDLQANAVTIDLRKLRAVTY